MCELGSDPVRPVQPLSEDQAAGKAQGHSPSSSIRCRTHHRPALAEPLFIGLGLTVYRPPQRMAALGACHRDMRGISRKPFHRSEDLTSVAAPPAVRRLRFPAQAIVMAVSLLDRAVPWACARFEHTAAAPARGASTVYLRSRTRTSISWLSFSSATSSFGSLLP
jgi:hypothetical protein